MPISRLGAAFIHRNTTALPRARLIGKPVYADNQTEAIAALDRFGTALRDQLVVEDPDRPLAAAAVVSGKARIVEDRPERVVVDTDAATPAYLVLGDTFDPGWSATVDGQPAPIRPAYVAFRAVYLAAGTHTVVFTYRPGGVRAGLNAQRLRDRARPCLLVPAPVAMLSRRRTRRSQLACAAGGNGGS